MTSTKATQEQITDLRERELNHLRTAYRAQRAALEAEFFSDEVACHNAMVEAKDAMYAALMCAEEAVDLAVHHIEGEHL